MIEGKEKTTVPIPSVGADGEQPISNYTTSIISADSNEINPQFSEIEDDFDETQRRIARMNDPSYLNAITMTELFDTVRTLTVTSSPPTRIVTVSEGRGNHYKRVPGRGVVRRQWGSAPSPSESPRYFAARKDESIIVGYYTLKKCRSPNRYPKIHR